MKDPVFRVLHLVDQHYTGGPGKTIINTARFSSGSKFPVHVGTFVPKGLEHTEFSKHVSDNKIPLLKLSDGRGVSFYNLHRLYEYIVKNDIAILHTHTYKADFHGLILKSFLRKVRLVTTHHGWITNSPFQAKLVKLDLLLSRYFDGIIAVSKKLLLGLPRQTCLGAQRAVINNALVLEDYHPAGLRESIRKSCGFDSKDIVVGVVGRLSPEKGFLEMIDAFNFARTKTKCGKLLLIGDGPISNLIKIKIKQLAIENDVMLAGYQNPVQPFYEAMDILVSPSFTEGLSNVILEAFAYKLPVIATDVGGNSEIICSGTNGLLVVNNEVAVLGEALKSLLLNNCDRLAFGERGYQTVKNKFDFKERVSKESFFYETLLRETPPNK